MKTDEQKKLYIDQAFNEALGQQPVGEKDLSERIRFWQCLSSSDRMAATWEITKRVDLGNGGKVENLRLNKSVSVLKRRLD